jgi:DUF4097 and DUF4098 domain-containing protein YvlB
MNKLLLVALLAAAAAFLPIPVPFLAAQDSVVAESDHDLDEGAAVSLDSIVGTLRIRTGDQPKAHLKTAKRGRDAELVTFHVDSGPKKLHVESRFPRNRMTDVSIEIDLTLPRTALASLKASTVSGSLDLQDLRSKETVIKSTSGNIQIFELRSDLILTSVSGKVTLTALTGSKAEITMTSGSLRGSGELSALRLENVSGDVTFDLIPPKDGAWSARASNTSGDIALRLPRTAGGSLELFSVSGKTSSGLDLRDRREERKPAKRSLRGAFGQGSGVVHLDTVSGTVRVDPLD